MDYHTGRDVRPSQRTEIDQNIDGFADIAIIQIDTVLRNDHDSAQAQLRSLYTDRSEVGEHDLSSGESAEVVTYSDPSDETLDDNFEKVVTYSRNDNYFFTDLISVAVVTDEVRHEIETGEMSVEEPQHSLNEFLSEIDTITCMYRNSHDIIDGLPITSIVVAVPKELPPIKTRENGLNEELVQQCTADNKTLFRSINFETKGPSSAIEPGSGFTFLISNQSMHSPFGPYSAIYFHPSNSTRLDATRPSYRYVDGFRSLVPLFRRVNWLRHRKQQIAEAEDRLLRIDERLQGEKDRRSLMQKLIGHHKKLSGYESVLHDFRTDAQLASRIQEEMEALGNPYREKTTLNVEIGNAFPIEKNWTFARMLNDGVYQNLVIYCAEEAPFIRRTVSGVIERHEIARESIFAEISVSSTRETIRLQHLLLFLTAILLVLTGILVIPVLPIL